MVDGVPESLRRFSAEGANHIRALGGTALWMADVYAGPTARTVGEWLSQRLDQLITLGADVDTTPPDNPAEQAIETLERKFAAYYSGRDLLQVLEQSGPYEDEARYFQESVANLPVEVTLADLRFTEEQLNRLRPFTKDPDLP